MNLKQLFCKHDWYTLYSMTKSEIKEKVTCIKLPSGRNFQDPLFYQKVCLKCRKFVDEITPEYDWQKSNHVNEKIKDQRRKNLAQKIVAEDRINVKNHRITVRRKL